MTTETVVATASDREVILASVCEALAAGGGPQGPAVRLTMREEQTVDGRRIEPGALSFDARPAPWPLLFNPRNSGHADAIVVGVIETAERHEDRIELSGRFDGDDNPAAVEAARLVGDGILTSWSPDIGDPKVDMAEDGTLVLKSGVFLGGTIVPIQALSSARIELVPEESVPEESIRDQDQSEDAMAAGATGSVDLPVAPRDRPWNGAAAAARVFAACTRNGTLDDRCASRAFFWRDSEAEPGRRTAYKLGFADIVDGRLTMIPRGVFAAAAAVSGARGGVDIPESDMAAVRTRIERAYARLRQALGDDTIQPPWRSRNASSSAEPARPPLDAFFAPEPSRLQPLLVVGDRVTGHLASWRTCHIGISGRCQLAPRSGTDYAAFHTASVLTQEGEVVAVGRLTADTVHADLSLDSQGAKRHYEDSGTVWALVRATDGAHGIWLSGWVIPGTDPAVLARAAACPLSGDWRRIGGQLELVAALSVPVPGFPLVASGDECDSVILSEPDRLAALEQAQHDLGAKVQALADVVAQVVAQNARDVV